MTSKAITKERRRQVTAKSWQEIQAKRGDPKKTREYQRERRALEVARAVRDLRHKAGLSQVALADRMHTSQPTVARWEAGLTTPTLDTLRRLARATQHQAIMVFAQNEPAVVGTVSARIQI